MRIIFNDNGGVSFITPTPNALLEMTGTDIEKLIAIANRVLPASTKFEIVADADVDKTTIGNRGTWQYVSGPNEQITGGV